MKVLGACCAVVLAACQFSTSTTGGTFGRTGGGGGEGGGGGGSHTVTVPDLFQLTQAQAEAAIRKAGITGELQLETNHGICGSVVEHQVVELGHVCRQAPAAGQQTSSSLFVTILVQTENPWHGDLGGGRRWFLLPDLAGMTVDQARDKLRALGFTASDRLQISYVDEPGCKPNIVCRTYPEAMTRTDTTSDKLLYAGRPPETAQRPQAPTPPAPTGSGDATAPTGPTPPTPPPAKKPDLGDLF